MKTNYSNYLKWVFLLVTSFLLLSNKSIAQPNTCLKIGMNVNGNPYYGPALMMKDAFKQSSAWSTQSQSFTLSSGGAGWQTGLYYAIPTDANGWPTQGLPVPQLITSADNGYNTLITGTFNGITMSNYTLRELPFALPAARLYVYWKGNGTFNMTYQDGVYNIMSTVPGTFGTTSVPNSYDVANFPGAGVGLTPTWVGGNLGFVSNTAGVNDVHYAMLDLSVVPAAQRAIGGNIAGIRTQLNQTPNGGNYLRDIKIIYPNLDAAYGSTANTNNFAGWSNSFVTQSGGSTEYFMSRPFHPRYLDVFRGFSTLRFMAAMGANGVTERYDQSWTQRKTPDYYSYTCGHDGKSSISMPYEILIRMANEVQANPWFNIPPSADVPHMQSFAKLVHDSLNSNLNPYVEVGNEMIWNFAPGFNSTFVLFNYANINGIDFGTAFANLERQAWGAFINEFGPDSGRVKRVLAGQAVNPYIVDSRSAIHYQRGENWDYNSITWYFSAFPGNPSWPNNITPANVINNYLIPSVATPNTFNDSYINCIWKHGPTTTSYGKKMSLYEGGLSGYDATGGPAAPYFYDNYQMVKHDPAVRALYNQAIDSVRNYPFVEEINHFIDWGGQYTASNGTRIPAHGYGALTTMFADTTVSIPLTGLQFGSYTINAGNYNLPWKELRSNFPVTSVCSPVIQSNNIAAGNALKLLDTKQQYTLINGGTNVSNLSNYTFEFWVRPEKNGAQDIISFSNSGNSSSNIVGINSVGRVYWQINNTAGTNLSNLIGFQLLPNQWYHIAAVQSGGALTLYVNGTVVANGSAVGTYNTNRFILGASRIGGAAVQNYFRGQIDEVRIWNGAAVGLNDVRDFMCKKLNPTHPNFASLANYYKFDTISGFNLYDSQSGTFANNSIINATTSTGIGYYALSGAAIGDQSVNIYPPSWGGISLSYNNTNGDIMQVYNLGSGSPEGVHIYYVGTTPSYNTKPKYYTSMANQYYGVFCANGVNPKYDVTYYYQGNAGASSNPYWNRLVSRADNSVLSWQHSGARLDEVSKSLILACKSTYRGEYILGVRQNQVVNRPGSGRAMMFQNQGLSGVIPYQRPEDYTISFWFYNWGGRSSGNLLGFRMPGGCQPSNEFMMSNQGSNDDGTFTYRVNGCGRPYTGIYWNASGGINGLVNEWNHFALVRQNGSVSAYMNGILTTNFSIPNDGAPFLKEFTVGGQIGFGGPTWGGVDEISIWKNAFTQTEIQQMMCQKITPAHPQYCNLDMYFNFDEGQGSVLENFLGAGDLEFPYNPIWSVSGASIGDKSAFNYQSPQSVTLTHPDGDAANLQLINKGGNVFGAHLYYVDGAPYYTGALPAGVQSLDTSRYWGMFVVPNQGSRDNNAWAAPLLNYSYGPNKRINPAAIGTYSFIERRNNSYMNWKQDPSVSNNTTTQGISMIYGALSVIGWNAATEEFIVADLNGYITGDYVTLYAPQGYPTGGANFANRWMTLSVSGPNTVKLFDYYYGNGVQTFSNGGSLPQYIAKGYSAFQPLTVTSVNTGTQTLTVSNMLDFATNDPVILGIQAGGVIPGNMNLNSNWCYGFNANITGTNTLTIGNPCGYNMNTVGTAPIRVSKIAQGQKLEWVLSSTTVNGFQFTNTVPTVAGIIGQTTACQGATQLTYRVKTPLDINAQSFLWRGTSGLVLGPSTKDTITVNIVGAAGSVQTLTVQGINNVGRSIPVTLNITVSGTGYLSQPLLGPPAVCAGTGGNAFNFATAISPQPISMFWTITGGGAITASTVNTASAPTATVSVSGTSSKVTLSLYANYACGVSLVNFNNIDVSPIPNTSLVVIGDSLCNSDNSTGAKISVRNSELGVTYYLWNGGTLITTGTGNGSTLQMTYPKASLPTWTTQTLTIRAQSGYSTYLCPVAPVTLTQPAYALMGATLTGAQLTPTLLAPSSFCYDWSSGQASAFMLTITGAQPGVTYQAQYQDITIPNGSPLGAPFYYPISNLATAQTSTVVLNVQPGAFPYWLNYNAPTTITATAQPPGCPTQYISVRTTITTNYQAPVVTPSRLSGPGIGIRLAGDDDRNACGAPGSPNTYFTTANGGAPTVFTGRTITVAAGTRATNWTTFTRSGGSITLADVANNDVLILIATNGAGTGATSYPSNGGGINLNGTKLYVRNVNAGAGTFELSNTRNGASITWNAGTFTQMNFWAPVTIDIVSGSPSSLTIPARFLTLNGGSTGLNLYSQIQFESNNTQDGYSYNGTVQNLLNGGGGFQNGNRTYFVASIAGTGNNTFMLGAINPSSGEAPMPYFAGKGIAYWSTSNNIVTVFQGDLTDYMQAGDILRDMSDNLIGVISGFNVFGGNGPRQILLQATPSFGSAASGSTFSWIHPIANFGNAFSIVLKSGTSAYTSGGYTWKVTPSTAVTNLAGAGGGGTYNAATGILTNTNADATNNKSGLQITWNPTFSGLATINVVARNQCGVSTNSAEPNTPGYNRTTYGVYVDRGLPATPSSIVNAGVQLCDNPSLTNVSVNLQSSEQARGGYQWIIKNAGTSTINPATTSFNNNPCAWSRDPLLTATSGLKEFVCCGGPPPNQCLVGGGANFGGQYGGGPAYPFDGMLEVLPANAANTANINWDQNFTGVATVCTRSYGCGNYLTNMLSSPWVCSNITISGIPALTGTALAGPTSRCYGPGTSNYVGSNPNAGSFNYFMENALNVGLKIFYNFPGNNNNNSTSVQSFGPLGNLVAGGAYITDRFGATNNAMNINGSLNNVADCCGGGEWQSVGLKNRFTLGAWIRPADVNTGSVKMIYGGDDNAGIYIADNKFGFYARKNGNTAIFPANFTGGCMGGNGATTVPGITITPGVWQHVAMSFVNSGAIATAKFYYNGALITTMTATGAGVQNGYGMNVGEWRWCGNNWNGGLDDIVVYNRDLTDWEVQALNTVTSIPVTSPAGTIAVSTGILTWSPTFTGIANIGVVPIGCSNPGYPFYSTVTVTSFPTITGVQGFNPSSCTAGASGSVQITIVGFTGSNGTLFNVDLNNDLVFEAVGTITSGVILVNTGLPSGSIITNVTIRQQGSLCTPATFPYSYVVGGGVAPSSTPGVSLSSSNPACSGSNAQVQVSGSQNSVNYYALLNGSVASTSTVVGTGGNINLTVLGAGVLTASGANQVYNFRVVAASTGCPSITLGGIGSLTVTGPSIAGTITGAPNPVCSGNNTLLTVTGSTGLIQWMNSTVSGSAGFANIVGANSATYASPVLNTNTWYAVQVTNGSCPTVSVTSAVTVTSPVATPVFTYGALPYCNNASIPAPTGTFSGGSFSTTSAGLSALLNTLTGAIGTSAPAGIYFITYVVNPIGGCPSVVGVNSLTITGLPATPAFTYNNPNCSNVAITTATSSNLIGGAFSSSSTGLSGYLNTANGSISAPNTLSGTFVVSYIIPSAGGCPVVSTTSNVTVTPLPATPVFNYGTGPWCNSGPASITTVSGVSGGAFSATGGVPINASTGNIAASTLSGTFTVTYTIAAAGGCPSVTGTNTVTLTGVSSTPSFTYGNAPYCNSTIAGIITSSGISSGYFIGSGALNAIINTLTGSIPTNTLSGTFTVTYFKPAVGGCTSVSGSNTVTITGLPATPTIAYASPFCTIGANPLPTVTGAVGGSVFSAAPAGLAFVSTSTGQINLSGTTQGVYTVSYTIPASGGCPAVVGTVGGVTINSLPGLLFGYTPNNVCTSASTTLTTGGTFLAGGSYASAPSMGAGLNASTGAVTPASLSAGAYLVSYTVNVPGCGNVTSAAGSALTITGTATAGTINGPATPICYNTATVVTLSGFAPANATIQWYQSTVSGTGPWTAVGASASTYVTNSLTSNNFYIATINNGICPTVTVASAFTVNVTPQSQGGTAAVTSSLPICAGSNANVQVTGNVGNIQWQSSNNSVAGFTDISGATSTPYATATLPADTWFRVVATNGAGCTPAISNPVLVSTTLCGITAAFTSTGTRFCEINSSGTGITFTDNSSTQAGSTITGRAWTFTGGTPSSTVLGVVTSGYNVNVKYLTPGVYSVLLSVSGTGGVSSTFTGIVTIDGVSTVGAVTVAATPICYNTSASVTIGGNNSGAAIQWASSTDLATYTSIGGANTNTYGTVLTTTTGFRAIITNGVCPAVTSTASVVSVNGQALSGTISGPSGTLCLGSPVALTLAGQQGSNIAWYVSNIPAFTSSTLLGNGNSLNTTANLTTAYYRVYVTNGASCTTVNSLNFVLNSSTCGINAVISLTGNNRLCANPNATFNFSDASSSSGTLSGWNWNFGTGAVPATSSVQNPGNVVYATAGVRTVGLTVTGTGGVTGTATYTITVDGLATAGTASSLTTIPLCYNTAANLTISGSSGAIQWQSSPDNTVWSDIASANATSYNTGNLTATTYYRATVTSGVCPVQTTGLVTATVTPDANTGTLSGPTGVCVASSQTMQTTGAVGTITWQESNDGSTWAVVGTGATLTKSIPYSPTSYYRVLVYNGAGCATTSSSNLLVNASVCGITPSLTLASSSRVCANPSASFSFTDNSSSAGTITGRTFVITGPTGVTSILGTVASPQTYNFASNTSGVYTATLYLTGTAGASATSAGVVFTIDGVSNAGTISSGTAIPYCYNTSGNLTVTGFTADAINWGVSTPGVGFAGSIGTGASLATPLQTTDAQYVVTVTNGVCPAVVSAPFAATMLAQATVSGFVNNAGVGCYGAPYVISVNGLVGTVTDWGYSLNNSGGPFASVGSGSTLSRNAAVSGNFEYYQVTLQNGATCASVLVNAPAISITGCTATAIINSTVNPNLCLSEAQGQGIVFTDASTSGGPIVAWAWDFGSGASLATSSVQNPPVITYSTPGAKTVILNITAAGGVTSQATKTFTIDALPVAGTISVDKNQACAGSTVNLSVANSSVTSGIWNYTTSSPFGTGSFANPNGVSVGSAATTWTFQYSGTNGTCTVPATSNTQSVAVTVQPTATISYATTPMCKTSTQDAVLSGYTVGGVFTSSPTGYVNSSTGQLQNLNTLTSQTTVSVTLSVPGIGGCNPINVSTPTPVTINMPNSVGSISLQYPSGVCNDWNQTAAVNGITTGATVISTFAGNSLTVAPNGNITFANKPVGTYNTYQYIGNPSNALDCPVQTSNVVQFILKAPYAKPSNITPQAFGYPATSYCKDVTGKISPIGIDPNVGTGRTSSFADLANGADGPVLTASNGQFDPTASTVNNVNGQPYTILWQVNENQCNTYSEQVTIKVFNKQLIPNLVYNQGSDVNSLGVCSDIGNIGLVSGITSSGSNWKFSQLSNIPNVTVDANTGNVQVPTYITGTSGNDRVRVLTIGLSLTTTGAPNCPVDNKQYTITVTSKVKTDTTISYGNLNAFGVYCADPNVQPISVSSFSGGAFSYSVFDGSEGGNLSLNPVTGTISPAASTPGKYRVQYIIPKTNACGVQSVIGADFTITSSVGGKIIGTDTNVCVGSSKAINIDGIRPNSYVQWQYFDNASSNWVNYKDSKLWATSFANVETDPILTNSNTRWRANVAFAGCLPSNSSEIKFNVVSKPTAGVATGWEYDISTGKTNGNKTFITLCNKNSTSIKLNPGYIGDKIKWYASPENDSTVYPLGGPNMERALTTEKADSLLTDFEKDEYSKDTRRKYYWAEIRNTGCTKDVAYSNVVTVELCKRYENIPNALAPNAKDQANAIWDIRGLRLKSGALVKVYNRYGIEVYTATGDQVNTNPWDGGGMPAGTYYYWIDDRTGGQPKTGAVTIIK
ncbi:MAG: LamG-like jellyroll fold domain-containing protein [Bacteroidota bacterium]|nr:LamG-like jellyroll fold domain-containing protein [Bacteroidota bacterium]